jgi:hypothetical protein
MNKFLKWYLLVFGILAVVARAGYASNATTGAQILDAVADARTAALGRTFVGIAGDINCLFYNPAGLAQIVNMEIPVAKNYYADDVTQQYIGFAGNLHNVRTTNVNDMGTIAANYVTLETGDIVSRNDTGSAGPVFRSKDQLITIGYGKSFLDSPRFGNCMGGFSVKLYDQQIQDYRSNGQAFDAGALWKVPGKRLFVGFAAQNMGPSNKFISEEYDLPSVLKLGLSGGLFNNACIVGVDLKKPFHDTFNFSTGIEFWANRIIALRVGYNGATYDSDNGLSAGFGISLKQADIFFMYASEICIDYAFIPMGDLGATHRLSILLKLGAE